MANVTARNVDFSGVKDGGNFNKSRIPAGDYLAKITKVEDAESKKDQIPQYLFSIKIESRSSSVFPYYCKLQENQLWKLRNLLIAAGKTVPKKRMKVDPNAVVGKLVGVTIVDAEYEGKEQSEIDGIFPAAELGDSANDAAPDEVEDDEDEAEDDGADLDMEDADADVEDEEPEEEVEEEPEPEEKEAEEEDPYAGLDRLEIRKRIAKLDKSIKTTTKQTDDDLKVILAGLEAAAAKPAAKPATKAKAKPKAADVSDDELDELDIDDL